jgi:hypothetical protein
MLVVGCLERKDQSERDTNGVKSKFMDKSQWQISRGFVTLLLALFFLWLVAEFLVQPKNSRTKAMIIKTRSDERWLSALLEERAVKTGGLTNLDRRFVLNSLFATDQNHFWLDTNTSGDVVDIWQTPYRIELAGRTNFIIRSAGKDRKFGDQDDIVFNSVSNDFVKP